MGTKDKGRLRAEQAERLVRAREQHGLKDATAGAAYLGQRLRKRISKDTYIQHESGTRGISRAVDDYAAGYEVAPEWLLYGVNPPEWANTPFPLVARAPFIPRRAPAGFVPVVGYVAANPSGDVLFANANESWDIVEISGSVTKDAVALEVRGDSMRGIADDGSLIYFEEQHRRIMPDMLNHLVVAELETGEVLLKRLVRGSGSTYDLESINGERIKDVRVKWIAEVTDTTLPKKAKALIRRGGLAA